VAQALDVVEVDPHALADEEPAPLGHRGDGAERGVERVAQRLGIRRRSEAIPARARLGAVRALVGDEVGLARLLLAELEAPAGRGEVRVALDQDAAVLRSGRQRQAQRALGLGVAGLELHVATRRGRGHGGREGIGPGAPPKPRWGGARYRVEAAQRSSRRRPGHRWRRELVQAAQRASAAARADEWHVRPMRLAPYARQ
jgi:hypothetical protein